MENSKNSCGASKGTNTGDGNWVNQDFAIIILLVENSYLADKFGANYVLSARMLYNEILGIEFP